MSRGTDAGSADSGLLSARLRTQQPAPPADERSEESRRSGAELLEEPFDSPHGFRGFSLRDPEGNIWDVAWKRGSTVTPDGDLTWSS